MAKEIKKVLVTGGAGFIGSHFVRKFLEIHPEKEVVVLDALTYAGNMENLSDLVEEENLLFVEGDINDRQTVCAILSHVDAVVHFAAETHVDRSVLFAEQFLKTDVMGTYLLLEASREVNLQTFLHISTDEVYGEAKDNACGEKAPFYPKSPYAASKAAADRLAYAYFETYGIPVVITRCVNNFGPYQHPEKMVPLFITQAMQDKPLPVYGTGENRREWIAVEDHVKILLDLLFQEGVDGEVFNLGTGEERSVLEVAQSILSLMGKNKELIHLVPDRPAHVVRHAVDTTKLKERIGFTATFSFEDYLRKTVQWYQENEGWWRKLRARKEFGDFTKEWYKGRVSL